MNAFYMKFASIFLILLLLLTDKYVTAFIQTMVLPFSLSCRKTEIVYKSSLDNDNGEEEMVDESEAPIFGQSKVKIDDHGSDLTNRFKYQVNALMGNFDPVASETDNEYTNGNILNALLNFPTAYVFNVVGKTKGDKNFAEEYINKVKQIVQSNSGDANCMLHSKPRGNNFTKVEVEVTVQSSSMITRIYEELADIDETVMIF